MTSVGNILTSGGDPETERRHREERERQLRARIAMVRRKAERIADEANARHLAAMEAETQARRDLEEHARRLAREIERARAANSPNPWLRPGDEGYLSPLEFELRQRLLIERQQQERTERCRRYIAESESHDPELRRRHGEARAATERRRQLDDQLARLGCLPGPQHSAAD